MSNLFETEASARAVRPEFGTTPKGKPKIRVEFEIVDGDHKGKHVPWEGRLDEKSIKYTKRDMLAMGWQGKSVSTFANDVLAANKTLPIKTRIAEFKKDDGSVSRWTAVDRIGGAPPLEKADSDTTKSVDDWFAAAGNDDSLPF